jgi:spore coat polysaccharide biosynthesis predicted glycosyltransferase SpsG
LLELTERVPNNDYDLPIGIVVDAGPRLGYGHAVRCLRLARALGNSVEILPLSDACSQFFEANGSQFTIRRGPFNGFPPIVVTDLRETHGLTAAIRRSGALHVSIHDLGLGQCRSDAAIDGSVVQLFPFAKNSDQMQFLGPTYMITRRPVMRAKTRDTVLVTLGGGDSAAAAKSIAEQLTPLGLRIVTTGGFGANAMTESELEEAMSASVFAISASGTALYDLLASGIPTIAVALDRLQLRTAEAFRDQRAVISVGLLEKLWHVDLMSCCYELLKNRGLGTRMSSIGKKLVDGQGLNRVVEIIGNLRRDVWATRERKVFTTC